MKERVMNLKNNISLQQVYDFVKSPKDVVRLGKATREDYDSMIKGTILFDKVTSKVAVMQIFKVISEDYTIKKMKEILKSKDCIHDSENIDKEQLCDQLWEKVKEVI